MRNLRILASPLSVKCIVPLHTTIILTVIFFMTIGIIVPLSTPSNKSLKLVYTSISFSKKLAVV